MKRNNKICVAIFLLALLIGAFTACGRADAPAPPAPPAATPTPAPADPATPADPAEPAEPEDAPGIFPIPGNHTISWWMPLSGNVAANFTDRMSTPFGEALQEATGVTIDMIHPAGGQVTEQFHLIVASREFPDIMTINWRAYYPGGPENAILDGVIHRLNDIWAAYSPHVLRLLEVDRPDMARYVRTEAGNYFMFPFLRETLTNRVFHGPFLRADWLEELGLDVPETVDEWEEILIAFRDEKGATAPFTLLWQHRNICPIAAAYGIRTGFYLDEDGNVIFGQMQDNFYHYLVRMSRWFAEGLIDPDWGSITTGDVFTARFTSGASGFGQGALGGALGVILNAMLDDPVFDLVPAPVPVLTSGAPRRLGQLDPMAPGVHTTAITTGARNVELAARFLDFGFSPEGSLLYNFGIEGVSWNWVDGTPTFTEAITNHPDGWPMSQAIASVAMSADGGPFMQRYDYVLQFFPMPRQQEALALWKTSDTERFLLPPLSFTTGDASRMAMLMGDINVHADEMMLRFILGHEELTWDRFNSFRDTLRSMGIYEALEIQAAAWERFNQVP